MVSPTNFHSTFQSSAQVSKKTTLPPQYAKVTTIVTTTPFSSNVTAVKQTVAVPVSNLSTNVVKVTQVVSMPTQSSSQSGGWNSLRTTSKF